ncbi:MAG: GNAT family N-acetyltransferase [Aminipila sp.]
MTIRLEQEKDYFEVENLTREAFWNVYRPGCYEHLVIHNLRNDACFVPELDYVLEEDNKIIANIAYAKGTLTLDKGGKTDILLFGPLSVLPEYQGKGYGTRIIKFTLDKAKQLGHPVVVITGNPMYYNRFGFESASKYGIYYEGMDKSEEASFFMVKVLDNAKIKNLKGTYSDPKCYFVDQEELEAFDKAFLPKVKEVKEGQLE